MTVVNNSSFKVKAESVANTTGIVPEKGAVLFDLSIPGYVMGDGTNWLPVIIEPYSDSYWLDLLGPLTGNRLDSASTRYAHDVYNGAIAFDNDARYPEEYISIEMQLQHYWKLATDGKPHLHWKQQAADIPNWLFGYKIENNGEASAIEVDFSNFTLTAIDSHEFTYTSGVLNQISDFPEIDLSTANISSLIHVIFFRDTANASGIFAGADPSSLTEYATDLDIHIEVDMPGSRQEYIK